MSIPQTVNNLFSGTVRFRIPLYQRHYVWDKRNWEALWIDIEETTSLRLDGENSAKQHFTGAIVIQPNASYIEIIDGQQRLTTFQIILCAIRDTCEAFDDDNKIAESCKDTIQNAPGRNSRLNLLDTTRLYKLLPREGSDRDAFQFLVERKIDESSGLIRDAYDYFKDAIGVYAGEDYGKLHNLYLSILGGFTFSTIEVKPDDEPEKIFQTINGTGRALDEFDLLRNNLFLRAKTVKKRDEFYIKFWSQFEEDLEFWREPRVLDTFLEAFLRIKRRKKFDDSISLFDQYQDYYRDLSAELNINDIDLQLLEYEFYELKRYADVYQNMHDPELEIQSRIRFYNSMFNDEGLQLIADKALPVRLFILCLINEFRLPNTKLNQVLGFLESYVMRTNLFPDSTNPLREVMGALLYSINEDQEFSLVNLIYRLCEKMPGDQRVKTDLDQLPKNEKSRKQSSSVLMQAVGKYIFEELEDWNINEEDLFERFCETWASAEATLQSGFQKGLPIVYSRLPISLETKHRLANYKFMTDNGLIELSNCEIGYDNKNRKVLVMGNDSNGEVIIEEPLFAFPAGAELQPDQRDTIREIQDDIAVTDWLKLYVDKIGNSGFKHRLLLNSINATAVTRARHVLEGTLRSFDDHAIYMHINSQIVAVYMNGLYELNTEEMLRSTCRKFMTSDGLIELSEYAICQDKLIGTNRSENSNKKEVRDISEILFDFPTGATAPYRPCGKVGASRTISVSEIMNAKLDRVDVVVVTRGKYMLQGKIKEYSIEGEYNTYSVEMEVENLRVKVYGHSISHFFRKDEEDRRKQSILQDLLDK